MTILRPTAIALTLATLLVSAAHGQKVPVTERTALPSKGLLWGSKMTVESQPCCTPSPDTSRVILALSLLRLILSISSMNTMPR